MSVVLSVALPVGGGAPPGTSHPFTVSRPPHDARICMAAQLQNDACRFKRILPHLSNWSDMWKISINPKKTVRMSTTGKKEALKYDNRITALGLNN